MASEAEPETELCGNCKRHISVANFTIHEIHCKRNISVCNVCKEPFPTSEMDEHIATEHAKVTCKCKMTMEKSALEEHQLSLCPLRLLKCQFCELELAFNKLGDHEDYCGARTERCETCGRSVMTKDLPDHPKVCGKETEPKKPVQSRTFSDYSHTSYDAAWFDSPEVRSNFRDNMMTRVSSHVPSRFYGRSILTKPPARFERTEAQPVHAPRDRVFEPTNLVRNNSAERRALLAEERFLEPFASRLGRPNFDSLRSLSLQNNSRFRTESDLLANTEFYSKDTEVNHKPNWQTNNNLFSGDGSNHDNPPSSETANGIQLPCEFCEELFPEQDLILHQTGCNPRAFASFCNRRPLPNLFQEFEHGENFDQISQPSLLNERPRTPEPPAHSSQSIFIPCEFCGVLLEEDVLFHHQDQCDLCPENMASNSSRLPSIPTNTTEGDGELLEMPSNHLSNQDPVPTNRKNLVKESSGRPTQAVRPRAQARQPKVLNVTRAGFVSRQSNLDHYEMKRRNMEENSRAFRSQQNPSLSSQSNGDDFMRSNSTTRNPNSRNNNNKTKKLNPRPDDVQKEE
ncbi:TRAF-type zinc finger domain-containing protein 1 [Discoglossus pictus]